MNNIENNVLDISHNYYKYIMNLKNVNGVGLGFKTINGICTKEPCISVLVENKINKKYISKNNRIPEIYMGIKTDVIEMKKFVAYKGVSYDFKIRPLQGGSEIGILSNTGPSVGTLGCIVTRRKNIFQKDYFILSNNHVIADINKVEIGTPIFQPRYKNGNKNAIAYLYDYIKIKLADVDNEPINLVDAAIGQVVNKSLISNSIFGIGYIKGVSEARLGLEVKKSGIETGLTKGKIKLMGVTGRLWFDKIRHAYFKDLIVAGMYVKEGDSGSCVLNNNNEIIGLLSGGEERNAAINDIKYVLKELNIKIYTR